LLIYVGGFALMVGATLWQARPQPAQAPAAAQQPKSSHPVVT